MKNSKKILILGNQGYVGSVLVSYLKQNYQDSQIIGFDSEIYKNCLTSEKDPESFLDKQIVGDVRNFDESILDKVEVIVYLAAISNDPMGSAFQKLTLDVNFYSCIKIAKLAKKHKVKRFIFASSCSIYGSNQGYAKKEKDGLDPLTTYAKSKIESEKQLEILSDEDFKVMCLRFATACGSSPRLRLDLALNDFVASAFVNKKIILLSDGSSWRPFISVKDMCRAIAWVIYGLNFDNFLSVNIGSNHWNFQIKDLAKKTSEILNNIPYEIGKDKVRDKRSYKVNFDKFNLMAKGYLPEEKLENTIREMHATLEKINFNIKDFRRSDLIRLVVLKRYLNK